MFLYFALSRLWTCNNPDVRASRVPESQSLLPPTGFGDRDRDERGGGRDEEDMGPSRADMDSNWGATRKFVPSDGPRGGGGGFGDRYPPSPPFSPLLSLLAVPPSECCHMHALLLVLDQLYVLSLPLQIYV